MDLQRFTPATRNWIQAILEKNRLNKNEVSDLLNAGDCWDRTEQQHESLKTLEGVPASDLMRKIKAGRKTFETLTENLGFYTKPESVKDTQKNSDEVTLENAPETEQKKD